jgi:PAS domain S-box-containing protein
MDPLPHSEPPDPGAASQRRRALVSAQVGSWHRGLPAGGAEVDLAWCLSLDLDPCAGPDHLDRWARRIHPDDAGRFLRAHADLVAAGGRGEFEVEYRILTRDSRWLWLLQRGGITRRGADGVPLEAGGICIEIDARKRAEVETQQNESRLATALWGARAAFWQIHRPSDTAVRSPLWFAMTGYSREAWEQQPQPWLSRIHADDQPAVQRLIDEHLEGRSQYLELEYRLRCADGSWKWLMDRGRVVEWDFDGQPVAVIGVSIDIDAQKRSEMALRSTEARLETAIWGAGVGLYELDCVSGSTHWLNDWCSRFDLDPCEGDGHVNRWDDNIHPVDLPAARARFTAHLEGREEYYDAEYRIRTRSGEWRWMFERGRVVARDPQGGALRLVGTCMDIDQRKRAELAAEQSQQRLKLALDTARGCLWEWDVARQVFNDEYYLLHGVDPAEGRRDPDFWLNRVHHDDRDRIVAMDSAVLSGARESYDAQYRVRHADGRWRWVVDRFRGEDRDVSGRAQRLVGFLVDITAEVEAREAQLDTERTLAAVTAHAPALLLLLDLDARVRFANRPAAGMTLAQMLGRSLFELVSERIATVLRPLYAQVLADGVARSALVDSTDASGTLHVYDHRVAPVLVDGKATGLSVSAIEVTDRWQAEQQLRTAQSLFDTVASNVLEVLVLFDRDLRCVYINRDIEGLTRGACIGLPVTRLAPPGYQDAARDAALRVLQTGQAQSLEEIIDHSKLGRIHVEVRLQPVVEHDRINGVAMIAVDVTSRVRQREQLSAQATLLSMMREAVVLMRRDWSVRLSNPAFDALLGAPTGTLGGANIRALLQAAIPELAALHAGLSAELHQERLRGSMTREFDWRRPDGQWLRLIGTFTPVSVDGDALILAVYVDVTQERELERRIVEAAAREQRRLATALHDGLGQELTGIALMLRGLSASIVGSPATSRQRLDEIIALVNEAINSSRRLARGFAPVSEQQGGLRGALRTLAESSTVPGGPLVVFEDLLDGEPPFADATATHLLRVAQEATGNALRHSTATQVRISLQRQGADILLEINDDGQGFPDGTQGTRGRGIETMRYRAEALRGRLDIDTRRGVTIRCVVPVHSIAT